MTEIFNEKYSSESIADIYRDAEEVFDVNYNEKMREVKNDSTFKSILTFTHKKETVLLDKNYCFENCNDLERDVTDALKKIKNLTDVFVNESGFFDGEFQLIITVVE